MTSGSHQPAWHTLGFGVLLWWLPASFPVHCHFLSLPHISFFPGCYLSFQTQGSLPPYLLSWNVNHSMPRIPVKLEQRLLSKSPYPVHIILVIATLLGIHTSLYSLLFWPNQKIITSFPKWTPFLFPPPPLPPPPSFSSFFSHKQWFCCLSDFHFHKQKKFYYFN